MVVAVGNVYVDTPILASGFGVGRSVGEGVVRGASLDRFRHRLSETVGVEKRGPTVARAELPASTTTLGANERP